MLVRVLESSGRGGARAPAQQPRSLRTAAVMHGDVRVSLSRLESRFLALLAEQRLALPETNRPAGSRRVDAVGPGNRSPSSSTATGTTDPATPGNKTADANARRAHAATSSGDTPTATSSRIAGSHARRAFVPLSPLLEGIADDQVARARPELVQPPQDLHRLGAQLAVERSPVGLGELAGAEVELGVADLAVLGLLGRLEVRASPRPRSSSAAAPAAQRRR